MFLHFKIIFLSSVVIVTQTFVVQQSTKVRFCVEIKSLEKCQALGDALRIENSGIDLDCVSDKNCIKMVSDGSADVVVVNSNYDDDHPDALKQLDPVLYESYNENNLIIALIDADQENKLHELSLFFENKDDFRLINAALYIDHHRNYSRCARTIRSGGHKVIHLERYNKVKDTKNKKLICIHNNYLVVKPISEYKNCNVESNIPNAVMVKKGSAYKNEITQAFIVAVNKLGHGPKFELFGPFRGQSNLIFSDETKTLVPNHSIPNGIRVGKFLSLPCGVLANNKNLTN